MREAHAVVRDPASLLDVYEQPEARKQKVFDEIRRPATWVMADTGRGPSWGGSLVRSRGRA